MRARFDMDDVVALREDRSTFTHTEAARMRASAMWGK
jgi:hypothetical protein